jgi:hypothetical protein
MPIEGQNRADSHGIRIGFRIGKKGTPATKLAASLQSTSATCALANQYVHEQTRNSQNNLPRLYSSLVLESHYRLKLTNVPAG